MKKQKTHRRADRKKTTNAERKTITSRSTKPLSTQQFIDKRTYALEEEILTNLMRSRMSDADREIFDKFEAEDKAGTLLPDDELREKYDDICEKTHALITDQEINERVSEALKALDDEQMAKSSAPLTQAP